jgi:concanavalin A-like lectin/glucanase superfamily protein
MKTQKIIMYIILMTMMIFSVQAAIEMSDFELILTANNTVDLSQNAFDINFHNGVVINNDSYDYTNNSAYMSIADNDALSFTNGTQDQPFSITAWINDSTIYGNGQTIVSKQIDHWTDLEYRFATMGSGGIELILYDTSESASISYASQWGSADAYQGDWLFIAATYDGSGTNAGIKIYYNDVQQIWSAGGSGTYVSMENSNATVEVGIKPNYYASTFKMQDIKVYNRELSQAEITEASEYTCVRNWTCDYSCLPNGTQVCNTIIDTNSCGDTYSGNESEFSLGVCEYSLPDLSNNYDLFLLAPTATDLSNNSVSVTMNGGLTVNNDSFSFDGTDDSMTIGIADNFKFLHGANDLVGFNWTINFWMQLENYTLNDLSSVMANKAIGLGTPGFTYFYNNGLPGDQLLSGQIWASSAVLGAPGTDVYPTDYDWHMFTMTYDHDAIIDNYKMYVDNVKLISEDKTGTAPYSGASDYALIIGKDPAAAQYFLKGKMQGISVLDGYVFDVADIDAYYTGGRMYNPLNTSEEAEEPEAPAAPEAPTSGGAAWPGDEEPLFSVAPVELPEGISGFSEKLMSFFSENFAKVKGFFGNYTNALIGLAVVGVLIFMFNQGKRGKRKTRKK